MATITTTGTNDDPVTTTKGANETNAQWLTRHKQAIEDAGVVGSAQLSSAWGDGCSVRTDRAEGQTDGELVAAHVVEVASEFVECPP